MNQYGIVHTYNKEMGYGTIKQFPEGSIYLVRKNEVLTFHELRVKHLVLFDDCIVQGECTAKRVRVLR